MKNRDQKKEKLLRTNKVQFVFNDKEFDVFSSYCKKYKIKNRSKFIRETIMSAILRQIVEDQPTLFPLEEVEKKVELHSESPYKQLTLDL